MGTKSHLRIFDQGVGSTDSEHLRVEKSNMLMTNEYLLRLINTAVLYVTTVWSDDMRLCR